MSPPSKASGLSKAVLAGTPLDEGRGERQHMWSGNIVGIVYRPQLTFSYRRSPFKGSF